MNRNDLISLKFPEMCNQTFFNYEKKNVEIADDSVFGYIFKCGGR